MYEKNVWKMYFQKTLFRFQTLPDTITVLQCFSSKKLETIRETQFITIHQFKQFITPLLTASMAGVMLQGSVDAISNFLNLRYKVLCGTLNSFEACKAFITPLMTASMTGVMLQGGVLIFNFLTLQYKVLCGTLNSFEACKAFITPLLTASMASNIIPSCQVELILIFVWQSSFSLFILCVIF